MQQRGKVLSLGADIPSPQPVVDANSKRDSGKKGPGKKNKGSKDALTNKEKKKKASKRKTVRGVGVKKSGEQIVEKPESSPVQKSDKICHPRVK